MMPLKLLLFLSYSHALTIATLLAGLPHSLVSKLQRVQNCATHLVVRAPPHVHTTPILRHLHWLPVRTRISYKTACFCFNAITSSTPAYVSHLLHLYSPSRSLRSRANTRLLKIPLYKCKTKGDRAFSYFRPSFRNSLPLHIRIVTTIDTFESALKIYLFNLKESHHHHHQFLNREGRWGTADDIATNFLHFSLFSSALWDLPNSRPVHSLMFHLFFCLLSLLPSFTVPCKMVLARPDEWETCSYHFSLRQEVFV